MKRFLLITAGTVGGLGAVLSVTPPQLGSSASGIGNDLAALPTTDATSQAPVATQSPTSTATKPTSKPTSKPTMPTKTPQSSNSVTPTAEATSPTPAQAQTQSATPTATPTKAAPAPTPTVKTVSGSFAGPVVNTRYGNVQVEITVTNGKITNSKALLAPTGKNDRYSNFAIPVLKQQTLAAQSTDIQGASGASYTSYGWRLSLQGAMAKAGL